METHEWFDAIWLFSPLLAPPEDYGDIKFEEDAEVIYPLSTAVTNSRTVLVRKFILLLFQHVRCFLQ